jgi:hypothetical protein
LTQQFGHQQKQGRETRQRDERGGGGIRRERTERDRGAITAYDYTKLAKERGVREERERVERRWQEESWWSERGARGG